MACREEGEITKNLRSAVNSHCRECNDVYKAWNEQNDCGVPKCWLYPYRPGTGGDERKVRAKSAVKVALGKARFAKIGRIVARDKK